MFKEIASNSNSAAPSFCVHYPTVKDHLQCNFLSVYITHCYTKLNELFNPFLTSLYGAISELDIKLN